MHLLLAERIGSAGLQVHGHRASIIFESAVLNGPGTQECALLTILTTILATTTQEVCPSGTLIANKLTLLHVDGSGVKVDGSIVVAGKHPAKSFSQSMVDE